MSFGPLLPLLPFYYNESHRESNIELLNALKTICRENLNHAVYLIEIAFPDLFQKDGFEMFYEEHQRVYQLTLTQAKILGINIDENKTFADVAQGVFEKKTRKLARNNRVAFSMLLSLIRRKDNWIKFRR